MWDNETDEEIARREKETKEMNERSVEQLSEKEKEQRLAFLVKKLLSVVSKSLYNDMSNTSLHHYSVYNTAKKSI